MRKLGHSQAPLWKTRTAETGYLESKTMQTTLAGGSDHNLTKPQKDWPLQMKPLWGPSTGTQTAGGLDHSLPHQQISKPQRTGSSRSHIVGNRPLGGPAYS